MALPKDPNDLLHDLKSNNEEIARKALDELYTEYFDLMYRLAYNIVGSHYDAEDICQNSIKHIWKIRHKLEIKSSLRNYIYTCTRNRAIQLLRKNRKGEKEVTLMDNMYDLDAFESLKNWENEEDSLDESEPGDSNKTNKWFQIIDARKHEKAFKTFDMVVFQDQKPKDVAKLLGVSLHTIRTQLKNVKDILRNI